MHIFDMDGTLIDSNGIWREVDEAFLAKRGFPYTKEYYQGVAHTIFPLAAEFTKRYCHLEESVEDIMAEWMEMAGDAYATRVQVKPGVREYLDQCRRRGQRMMVLTSSVPAHCRAALGHLGLMPYFEEILFAHDLKIEKKDPEIFRVAARRMAWSQRSAWCTTTPWRRAVGPRRPGCTRWGSTISSFTSRGRR